MLMFKLFAMHDKPFSDSWEDTTFILEKKNNWVVADLFAYGGFKLIYIIFIIKL